MYWSKRLNQRVILIILSLGLDAVGVRQLLASLSNVP
jgi:hypothetical protein